MRIQLLIPAAGSGERLGATGPKALVRLAGQTMLARTLTRFEPMGLADRSIITVPPGNAERFAKELNAEFPGLQFNFVEGGRERQDSVRNALAELDESCEIVVIHDAARPFVPAASVEAAIAAADAYGAATVAIPSVDTILVGDGNAFLQETPDRSVLWVCQTPQVFRKEVIIAAHDRARSEGYSGTDDASLVRRTGGRVKLVAGHPLNIKITAPSDRALAECMIRGGIV